MDDGRLASGIIKEGGFGYKIAMMALPLLTNGNAQKNMTEKVHPLISLRRSIFEIISNPDP